MAEPTAADRERAWGLIDMEEHLKRSDLVGSIAQALADERARARKNAMSAHHPMRDGAPCVCAWCYGVLEATAAIERGETP